MLISSLNFYIYESAVASLVCAEKYPMIVCIHAIPLKESNNLNYLIIEYALLELD